MRRSDPPTRFFEENLLRRTYFISMTAGVVAAVVGLGIIGDGKRFRGRRQYHLSY